MEQLNIALTTIGIVVILVGLLSIPIKKSLVQEPMIAVLVGTAVGPFGLGWLDLDEWGETTPILEQAARLTLAIGLMGVALRIHKNSLRTLWRPVSLLLTAGMLGMWLASSALAAWLLDLPLWMALLVGAIVTPTDPVVASSIVTGPFAKEHLPLRVRDAISLESGANDGLAYVFVMLPILMLEHPPMGAWQDWFLQSLLVGVVLAVVIGSLIGYCAAKAIAFAEGNGFVEKQSLLGYTVAFSLVTLGAAELVGADALISVFLAGFVFNMFSDRQDEHNEENIQEAVAKLFTLPMFVIFGIALPISQWMAFGWPLLAMAMLVLLLRRPPVLLALVPMLRGPLHALDVGYMGWFGPVGVAAIYYANFAQSHVHEPIVWYVASAVVFSSIMVHGITAAPLTRAYSSRNRL
ncbi:cation:proton antiporter domain-containing protein [Rhizobium halophilum]|uniref:cation:proton antiporter domain-containing protein n=1 Tax=Rhizobium halophilum TaxID=2846852 RepID=UPI001EFCA719|nr:cation:proton antiporter [Rhizobium halophilum]MCF6369889.1 cation:proton antiporter [Rhizobium halophilum]